MRQPKAFTSLQSQSPTTSQPLPPLPRVTSPTTTPLAATYRSLPMALIASSAWALGLPLGYLIAPLLPSARMALTGSLRTNATLAPKRQSISASLVLLLPVPLPLPSPTSLATPLRPPRRSFINPAPLLRSPSAPSLRPSQSLFPMALPLGP